MSKRVHATPKFIVLIVIGYLICTSMAMSEKQDSSLSSSTDSTPWYFSTELSIPFTGSIGVTLGKPLSPRLLFSNFIYYFDRDWMILLEKGDWHSRSMYIGPMLQYYPFSRPGSYEGYFIGGDTGLATSYQTYKPLNESDIFFFPFIDVYFLGYTQPLGNNFLVMGLLGGGWADVESQVEIGGKRNTQDYYPLVNLRLSYKW